MSVTKEDVLRALSAIEDPDLHRNIVELGFVKNVAVEPPAIRVTIELTTPACPVKDQMKAQAEEILRGFPGISQPEVTMTANVTTASISGNQLPNIKNAIAVSSGKGGVGKSTTAVNLAVALAKTGATVGLLDADVYGPDTPMMLGIQARPDQREGKFVPPEGHGVRTMSIGYFLPSDDNPVVWRGPMIHKFLQQCLIDTDWGELDYLIVDMPPGTGDAQLSISQILSLAGAVVVTTPQSVSTLDVRKAIAMFRQVEVDILGLVENMAYFVCDGCDKKHRIFGEGGADELAERYDCEVIGRLPINPAVREGGDTGAPIVVANPESEEAKIFQQIAGKVAANIAIRNRNTLPILQ